MKKLKQFHDVGKDEFLSAVASSYNKSEVARCLGVKYVNGTTTREIGFLIDYFDVDVSHFDRNKKNRRYEIILKECPVCKNEFESLKDHPREKVVCSNSCSNTYFRSGENHPNWKSIQEYEEEMKDNLELRKNPFYYRKVCFHYHEPICIICGEDKIVAVHHYDENKENFSPENLIPMCPTHHQYVHSNFAHLVEEQIEDFRNQVINKQNGH